ncbi:MAG TPA: HEAT repeat domain-containing protein [Bryobacteraceae bacterium]|nr:HEAT repeat domain-containing protein [Bryobacteraceae bacterium]
MRCVLMIYVLAISAFAFEPDAQERAREAERAAERAARSAERAEQSADRAYERAARALDKRQWDEAAKAFGEVPRTSPRADGALYWAAYAENKVGRRAEALGRLSELEKSFPNSRWVNDAKALAIEIRQAQGQPAKPESEDDEELKLMALNGLMRADPERAVPMLERVLAGTHSPQLKERAMFVLIQSGSPKAREIVLNTARGKVGNPDLQLKAIQYLGVFRTKDSMAALSDIAKTEKNPEMQAKAIEMLGIMGPEAAPELKAIYAANPDKRAKRAALRGLFIQHNAAAIVEIARKETDPELKREAVQQLSVMKSKEASDYMMEILK